jgi:hypothetical protein
MNLEAEEEMWDQIIANEPASSAAPPPLCGGAAEPADREEGTVANENDEECAFCFEVKPYSDGDSVLVYTHRIDGRAVAEDYEWVCNDCIESAEEARTERMIEARQQYYYEK